MHDYLFLIPITIALLIGVVSPGPSFLLVAQTALQKSRAHGIATAVGMGLGAVVFALIASYGLFVLLQTVPGVYAVFKIIGGVYLCYLAWQMWRQANAAVTATQQVALKQQPLHRAFLSGLLTQLSNPKTAIVFGSVFMAFLPTKMPENTVLILSLMAFIIDTAWYVVVAFLLTTPQSQRFYLRFKKQINRLAGGLMGLLGAKLALNQ